MEKRILQQIFIKSNTLYLTVISDKILLKPKPRHLFHPRNTPGEKNLFQQFDLMIAFCYETGSSSQFSLEPGGE